MEIVVNNPGPASVQATGLIKGQVYRMVESGYHVMKVCLGGTSGTRVVYLATGDTVGAPHNFEYIPVDAKLVVN